MNYTIEFERETDGRWIAEISTALGAIAYGATKEEAAAKARAIAKDITSTEAS
jgi:predicted RNase H-like HicB family nuclease